MIPFSAFILFKLVDYRISTGATQSNDIFASGIFGGLMQVPLPVPEILSSLNRTKYQ